jgi:hypothetical protein
MLAVIARPLYFKRIECLGKRASTSIIDFPANPAMGIKVGRMEPKDGTDRQLSATPLRIEGFCQWRTGIPTPYGVSRRFLYGVSWSMERDLSVAM